MARAMTTSNALVHGTERGSRQATGGDPTGAAGPVEAGSTESARAASRPSRFLMPEPYRRARTPPRPPPGFHTRV